MSYSTGATTKYAEELIETARGIVANGKGILAADESTSTIGKRFDAINLANTEDNRRAYRELLLTRSGELKNYIGGVIFFEETLSQKTSGGALLIDFLKQNGIYIGIKVDKGTVAIPGTNDEVVTIGLEGLAERCQNYYKQGARFAKWRSVLKIGPAEPSHLSIEETASSLARYASICQHNGLVPIVEPEILMDGSHDLDKALQVTQHVITACYTKLHEYNVILKGTLLKPNMVCPGASCPKRYTNDQIAWATFTALENSVPPAVPGITFLSGGQSEVEATVNLNAINRAAAHFSNRGQAPWALTFSYGRALQASVIKNWAGRPENLKFAQETLLERARCNSLAALGQYQGERDQNGTPSESLYEKDYKY